MAKTIADFKAPWEIDDKGVDIPEDEQVIDKERLKTYLFGLVSDKEKAQNARDAAIRERDTAKTDLDTLRREHESDEDRRQRELKEARDAAEESGKSTTELLRMRVALNQDGITAKQALALAARLTGSTEDELDADAKRFIADFGLPKVGGDDGGRGDDDGEDDTPVGTRPRARSLRPPGDPSPSSRPPLSLEDELATIPRPGNRY